MQKGEFEEIGHSGGKVTITVIDDPDGRRKYQLGWRHCRPNAAGLFAVYALPQGIVVGSCRLGGIGSPVEAPPVPGAFQVMIGSDSQGYYGHQCPRCKGYWRSGGAPSICPYCAAGGQQHEFLSAAQQVYVEKYMWLMMEALQAEKPGEYSIDMDAVADAVGKEAEKPEFYYAEESQQKKFICSACGEFNDILGTYGFCSGCGTRNDYDELQPTIQRLRDRINSSGQNEACVKEAVGAFDSFCGQYMKQLLNHIGLSPRRRERLEKMRFHNLRIVADEFRNVFDIDIFHGLKPDEVAFAERMFHRRHVYEHKGGEADVKYIEDSGDTTVRPKQALRETQDSAHNLVNLMLRMGGNLHRWFHEILKPDQARIKQYADRRRPRS